MKRLSVTFLVMVLFASLSSCLVSQVTAQSGVNINSDGSVYPPTAPIVKQQGTNRYYLTADLTGPINVYCQGIILDGADNTLQGDGIRIFNSSVSVCNFMMSECDTGITANENDGGSSNSIYNNQMENCDYGVYLYNSKTFQTLITGNTFLDSGVGVYISYSKYVSVEDNYFVRTQVKLMGAEATTLRDNVFDGVYWNPTIDAGFSTSNCIIEGNIIDNHGLGSGLFAKLSDSVINSNNISSCGDIGLRIYGDNNTIAFNHITNNTKGIELYHAESNRIEYNSISFNDVGLITNYDSNDNEIFSNNFISNAVQVTTTAEYNAYDDGSKGNYWSNYNGTDADSDGIGDTSFEISGFNIDRYPIMTPVIIPELSIIALLSTLVLSTSASLILTRKRNK